MTISRFLHSLIHTQLFRGALVLAVASFIVLMTSQPAVNSTESSQTVAAVVARVLLAIPFSDYFFSKINWPLDVLQMAPLLDHMVRKTAHFVEYAALGFVTVAWLRHTKLIGSRAYWMTPVIGFLFAASDEFHQTFVPGRSGQISDVMLDTSGCIAGLICYLLMKGIVRRFLKHSRNKNIVEMRSADVLSTVRVNG